MSYFREIPNLRYPSFLSEKTSSLDFVEVKNVFRRVKLRDDLQNNFTVFEKYEIDDADWDKVFMWDKNPRNTLLKQITYQLKGVNNE